MRILIQNGLWLGLFALLAACGQKGELYLPQEPVTPAPQTSSTSRPDSPTKEQP